MNLEITNINRIYKIWSYFASWEIFYAFLSSADFFQNQLFEQFFHVPSKCQTDWIQSRPDHLSGLIWVQSVCKCYQQTTLIGRVNTEYVYELYPSKYLQHSSYKQFLFCLFDLILYVQSTVFHLNRDGSSWVEPVLS